MDPPDLFDSRRHGFSQGVVVDGGRRVLLSGQVAVDEQRRTVGGTLEEQTDRALENVARGLRAAGAALADVVMLRIYIAESAGEDLAPVSRALRTMFPDDPPASTWVVVRGLADPSWLIEIEAEAVLP